MTDLTPVPDGGTVLVDLDGTVCDQLPRVCEYAREAYDFELRPTEITEWSYPLPELEMHIGELVDELMRDRPEWFLSALDPLPEVQDALGALQDDGYHLAVATHRHPDTHDVSRAWLADHGVPYDSFIDDVPANKGLLDGHVLVDDYHRNVANALAEGKAGVLMNRHYSDRAACAGAHVADSWADVLDAFGVST